MRMSPRNYTAWHIMYLANMNKKQPTAKVGNRHLFWKYREGNVKLFLQVFEKLIT